MDFEQLWNALQRKSYGEILGNPGFYTQTDKKAFLRGRTADKPDQPARSTFGSFEEYLATLSIAARLSQEYDEQDQRREFWCCANIKQLKSRVGNRVLATLVKVKKEDADAMTLGDKAVVRYVLPGMKKLSVTNWDLRFIEALPSSAKGTLFGVLERERPAVKRLTEDGKALEGTKTVRSEPSILSGKGLPIQLHVNVVPRHS